MTNIANDIEKAFHQIIESEKLDIAQIEYLIDGYAKGLWSSRRVKRELDIDRISFWYIKAYYGVSIGCSPEPHYWSEDEKQTEIERENEVADFIFNDGDAPQKKDSSSATFKRLRQLIKHPARRTIIVPINHEVIIKLHQLNRLDALNIDPWETHLSRFSLLVASHMLGFKETLRMIRLLPKSIIVNNEMYKEYRNVGKDLDQDQYKNFMKTLNFTANGYLATDLQDDAELNIDTIYLQAECIDQTIDSRNFMVRVETLLQLVDHNRDI